MEEPPAPKCLRLPPKENGGENAEAKKALAANAAADTEAAKKAFDEAAKKNVDGHLSAGLHFGLEVVGLLLQPAQF